MGATADDRAHSSLAQEDVQRLAGELWRAWQDGAALGALEPAPATLADGYAIQAALERHAGETFGYKIAATSPGGQNHIHVSHPLFGRLFAANVRSPAHEVDLSSLRMRLAEPEFAFEIGKDLAAGASTHELLGAISAVHLAVELPDSRLLVPETRGAPALIADDALAALFVLGPRVSDPSGADFASTPITVTLNGRDAAVGSGAEVLGDPRNALGWLVEALGRHGRGLRAGEIITTGTTTVPVPVAPGDLLTANFGELGSMSVRFAPA